MTIKIEVQDFIDLSPKQTRTCVAFTPKKRSEGKGRLFNPDYFDNPRMTKVIFDQILASNPQEVPEPQDYLLVTPLDGPTLKVPNAILLMEVWR